MRSRGWIYVAVFRFMASVIPLILMLDLSRFSATPSALLSYLSFESDRAFPAQCWVSASRVIEPVYVFEDRHLSLPLRFPWLPPDQFSFDGLKEGLDCCIVVAISLPRHRHLEPMLAQNFLIVMRTILRPACRICLFPRRMNKLYIKMREVLGGRSGPMRNIADQGYRVLSKPVRLAKRALVSHLLRWGRRCLSAQVFAKYKVMYLHALGVLRLQVLVELVSKTRGRFHPDTEWHSHDT